MFDTVLLVAAVSLMAFLVGEWLGYARGYKQGYEKACSEKPEDD